MKSVFASLALFVAAALAQGNGSTSLTINTPTNLQTCEPTLLNWNGGTPPYYLSILPGANPTGSPIESFPTINTTSYTWTVNINPQAYIGFTLRDSSGLTAQTAPVTIESGTSTSCVNITGVTSGGSVVSSASATSAGSTSAAATSASATAAGSASASPSSTSSSSSGASANAAQLGVAGIAGVAIAALFL